jgi:hypothetical protein
MSFSFGLAVDVRRRLIIAALIVVVQVARRPPPNCFLIAPLFDGRASAVAARKRGT